MNSLIIGLIGALASTNPPAAVSNLVTETTGLKVKVPDPNDPVEKEYEKLLADDDAASEEVDRWIQENQEFAAKGAPIPRSEMRSRIMKRLEPIRAGYEDFIKRHPDHARVRLAYASFLDGLGDEDASVIHLEKARELDPTEPAVWNNLANYYTEHGPTTNAFAYYEKAISLAPEEPLYYHNFGTTVCLYRKDAKEYYRIDEQQVFDKALILYSNAMHFDPTNFLLATDVAQTFYLIKPMRTNAAYQSWTNALKLAGDEDQREGVYIHLARLKMAAGDFRGSEAMLNAVTNQAGDLKIHKARLLRTLHEREFGTNLPPETSLTNSAPVTEPAGPASLPVKSPAKK